MLRRVLLPALAWVALGAAAAAAQEPVGARAFCLPGSTNRCLAFAITDEPAGFDVWLRNLTPRGQPSFNPFTVRQFSLARADAAPPGAPRSDLSAGFSNANVGVTGSARRGLDGLNENTSAVEYPAVRTFRYDTFGGLGVVGCALPAGGGMEFGFFVAFTCAERGADGWLRIAFRPRVYTEVEFGGDVTSRLATPDDVAVAVAGCVTHLGAASGISGPFDGAVACESSPYATSVVPEPGTLWTVGAGLAGAAAAARRARRRRAAA